MKLCFYFLLLLGGANSQKYEKIELFQRQWDSGSERLLHSSTSKTCDTWDLQGTRTEEWEPLSNKRTRSKGTRGSVCRRATVRGVGTEPQAATGLAAQTEWRGAQHSSSSRMTQGRLCEIIPGPLITVSLEGDTLPVLLEDKHSLRIDLFKSYI